SPTLLHTSITPSPYTTVSYLLPLQCCIYNFLHNKKGRTAAASWGERINSLLNKEHDSTLWQRKAPPT
ncbi:MAG: hypothetical protein ACXVDN_08890, partial [Ktedonobacteraceae bacterium]